MSLFDDIQSKTKRQSNMMAHFQKKTDQAVEFNKVDIEQAPASKSEKNKGLIAPTINYIEDDNSDGQTG